MLLFLYIFYCKLKEYMFTQIYLNNRQLDYIHYYLLKNKLNLYFKWKWNIISKKFI